jgi:O-antigen ligase/tetratricopeptide (TPR) repeat protein
LGIFSIRSKRVSKLAGRLLRNLIEMDVLLLVAFSPWAFGGAESFSTFILAIGLSAGLVLWAIRVLIEWKIAVRNCPVAWCLVALIAVGLWQIVPLPRKAIAEISPNTASFYQNLLPAEPESVLPPDESAPVRPQPGNTISFYPWETTETVVDLLAILGLFVLVQNNIANIGFLRRLSCLCLLNASALALFAIIQFYSSPHDRLFWKFTVAAGQVFGPFVCRNHFPFYTNISIGLSLGLLFSALFKHKNADLDPYKNQLLPSKTNRRLGAASAKTRTSYFAIAGQALADSFRLVFSHPAFLWIASSIAIVLAATVLSASRGGFVSICISLVILLFLRITVLPSIRGLLAVILLAAVGATAFFAWLGPGRIDHQITERWRGGALEDRLPLWTAAWPLVGEFPVLGTGYGTFQFVEPIHRGVGAESLRMFTFDHAHNEYLEALVEGGIVRLALTLLAICLVYKLGIDNIRRLRNTPDAGLVTGGLCGFTTVVVHSAGDFGVHMPAIAILATVVAATLCIPLATSNTSRATSPTKPAGSARSFFKILTPALGAVTLAIIALALMGDAYGRRLSQVYRTAANQIQRLRGSPELQIEYLKAVAALAPGSAEAQQDVGQKYLDVYEAELGRIENSAAAEVSSRHFLLFPCGMQGFGSLLSAAIGGTSDDLLWQQRERQLENELERLDLRPALQHYLLARDLCPLLVRPHLRLAAHQELLTNGDSQQQYWERAKFLAAQQPDVWYSAGLFDLGRGDTEGAWSNFRESLNRSPQFLSEILLQAKQQVSAEEILHKVLPETPSILLASANLLFPDAASPSRKVFLGKILEVLERQHAEATAETHRTKAVLLQSLQKSNDAVTAYRTALRLDAEHTDWRLELAELLVALNRYAEARHELILILARDPNHAAAKALLASTSNRPQQHQ